MYDGDEHLEWFSKMSSSMFWDWIKLDHKNIIKKNNFLYNIVFTSAHKYILKNRLLPSMKNYLIKLERKNVVKWIVFCITLYLLILNHFWQPIKILLRNSFVYDIYENSVFTIYHINSIFFALAKVLFFKKYYFGAYLISKTHRLTHK